MNTNHRQFSDYEFLTLLERGLMSPELFNHEAHIRMAWLYLTWEELTVALQKISKVIRTLDNIYADGKKYHHTITIFFSIIIYSLIEKDHATSWNDFLAKHTGLSFSKKTIAQYYSDPVISSAEAKKSFISPDLQPLPKYLPGLSDVVKAKTTFM